ncbi:MAG: LamG domain-containing protein [Saprospiraceae bacterium]|nr:MAG: LamG domain-containing protein [Saprospiraceae bacterium]
MSTNINIHKVPRFLGILFALLFSWNLLSGQNNALHFDGANDYFSLTPINGFPSNTDFTVEMWFLSTATVSGNCPNNFRRLFSLSSTGFIDQSAFEIGECGGFLTLFWHYAGASNVGDPINLLTMTSNNIRDNNWHCISVVRSANTVTTYLDGNAVALLSPPILGAYNFNLFRVGHIGSNSTTPNQDWEGYVDDVKLWSTALSFTQITACNPCVLTCNEPNLTGYWRLDDGVPNGNNTSLTTVSDCTSNGNNGILFLGPSTPPPFVLNGTTSNFVPSTAPILYPEYTNSIINVSDPLQTVGLTSICSGDPVHFSIFSGLAGNLAQAGPGTSVAWEYSDDCFATAGIPITPAGGSSALFSGFSFVSPPGHPATSVILALCSPNAFVDRGYRAIITVTDGTNTCTYTTDPFCSLRICCPVTASVNVNPAGPLCDGDIQTFLVSLTTNVPLPALSNFVHITWSVTDNTGTTQLSSFNDLLSFSYPNITVHPQDICFEAVVSNCSCPSVTVKQCVRVDPKPDCGTITGSASPPTLSHDPLDPDPDHYLICPGDDAAVEVLLPFTNCNKVWQYMFTSGSSAGVWKDLGTSNSNQNTNVLPHLKPASSPYLWPPGETCIHYRIECRPYNYPNSGCLPCTSNEVQICLKPAPNTPVITAVPNPICKNGQSYLSVQNVQQGINYEWFCNGQLQGFGDFFYATQNACYWVVASDGCQSAVSNKECVKICCPVAVISCPIPVCPCIGDQITLDASASFSNCGPLTYLWSWVDINGPHTANTQSITDIPATLGTTYTLTVTDSNGCTDMASYTVVPCPN